LRGDSTESAGWIAPYVPSKKWIGNATAQRRLSLLCAVHAYVDLRLTHAAGLHARVPKAVPLGVCRRCDPQIIGIGIGSAKTRRSGASSTLVLVQLGVALVDTRAELPNVCCYAQVPQRPHSDTSSSLIDSPSDRTHTQMWTCVRCGPQMPLSVRLLSLSQSDCVVL